MLIPKNNSGYDILTNLPEKPQYCIFITRMTLYKTQFQKMYTENRELFDNFKDIHDNYTLNPGQWQKLFNEYGKEILDVIREYERRLCATSEKGQFGKFSQNLSGKFWEEVRKIFPKIDFVGVVVS